MSFRVKVRHGDGLLRTVATVPSHGDGVDIAQALVHFHHRGNVLAAQAQAFDGARAVTAIELHPPGRASPKVTWQLPDPERAARCTCGHCGVHGHSPAFDPNAQHLMGCPAYEHETG